MTIARWFLMFASFCPSLQSAVFNPKIHQLSNGLTLIVLENHRAPLVTHMMCFKVGTNDSPWGKSGLAHYLEHLMFKGKPESAAKRLMGEVNRLGGQSNAGTSAEYTFYYETIPVSALEQVMGLDAERMTQLEIEDEWAVPEIKVILEERYMRIDNTVAGNFIEAFNALDIQHHPSRLPVIGWAQEIADYTTQDARDFYKKWYAPNNAFIVIAGDIRFEEARSLTEKYYGSLPSQKLSQRLNVVEPKQERVFQSFEMTSEIMDIPLAVMGYPAPTFNEGKKQEFYAFTVLEDILGRSVTGRLTNTLMEKKHKASHIDVHYDGLQSGPGRFQISIMPTPQTSLKDLEQEVNQEIQQLLKTGVTAEEVEVAKNYILSKLVYTQDDISEAAQNLASLYACGMSLEEIEAWPARIQGVTVAQVNEALKHLFSSKPSIIGRLLPKEAKTLETPK